MESKEAVNHPGHYNFGSIETIDYITSALGSDGCYDFCIGNAIKYITRAKHKGKQIEDLQKAIWYINYAIELIGKSASDEPKTTQNPNIILDPAPYNGSPTDYCTTCPNNLKNISTPIVGDWPCQWCSHSPYKITC